jgi:hypothetical protein
MRIICIPGVAWCLLSSSLLTAQESHPLLRPDHETLMEWIEGYERAPKAYIDPYLKPRTGSFSLLSHLDYIPAERDQADCGNCWAWAGTGCLAISMDVQKEVRDRLSVQYINSCENQIIGKTCCSGGWLFDLASFYSITHKAIPWSNSNAYWQDGDASCDISCSLISKSPYYYIHSISAESVETHSVGQSTAIANIKNVLSQNKAVWFGYFLATYDDWHTGPDGFIYWWHNNDEDQTWNPDFSCEHNADYGFGGHAVLCVGYNDDDPGNSYWIMLNSWGTAEGGRPNGLFRLDMYMDYDCYYEDPWGLWYSFYWQALDADFSTPTPTPSPTATSTPTATPTNTPRATATQAPPKPLEVRVNNNLLTPGDTFTIDVTVQPIAESFDAWALIIEGDGMFGYGGAIYSLAFGEPGRVNTGTRPLITGVTGLQAAYSGRLLRILSVPQLPGIYRVLVGLVPSGTTPHGTADCIPGYLDIASIQVFE